VFPCLSPDLDQDYFFGVVFGAGVVVPVVVVVFGFGLCFRGFLFIPPPPVVNETFCGSPGTLVNVKLSPTFFARSDIAGSAAGGFGLGAGGVRSPIMKVAAVYPQVVTAVTRPVFVSEPDVIVKLLPVMVSVASMAGSLPCLTLPV
jgi:hypothetical protein